MFTKLRIRASLRLTVNGKQDEELQNIILVRRCEEPLIGTKR